jgi:hypothetical protein
MSNGFIDSLMIVTGVEDITTAEAVTFLYTLSTLDSKNLGILIIVEMRMTGTTYLNNRRLQKNA